MNAPSEHYLEQQRLRKACELEDLAWPAGIRAADLASEETREKLRLMLAEHRGKRPSQVRVSLDTYRVLWRLLHDRETHGQGSGADPFANIPGADR